MKIIKKDLSRYIKKKHKEISCLDVLIGYFKYKGFRYSFWLRMSKNRVCLISIISRVFRKYLSEKYNIHISYKTDIGGGLYIGHAMNIVINPSAIIGENFNISHGCTIGSNFENAARIGNNVYIGPNCCLIEDIEIGDHVIIGAGSIVTRDLNGYSVYVGNPAKKIKDIEFNHFSN